MGGFEHSNNKQLSGRPFTGTIHLGTRQLKKNLEKLHDITIPFEAALSLSQIRQTPAKQD